MNSMKRKLIISLLFSFCFFIISFITLKDYCISWDEPLHFMRGQAYLHYYLTGLKNYDDLPKVNLQGTNGQPKNIPEPRRSFYQDDYHNGEFSFKDDIGHPPLNDQIAALSNLIFFQKLGWLDDINSFHLFNILASSILVFAVSFFMLETFGIFPALIATLILITHPLFFSEAHFNIKDPPETAFITMTILFFYMSLKKFSLKWLISSIVFFSLALGTKFNVLFLFFAVIPYLLIIHKPKKIKKIPKRFFITLFCAPIIVLLILFISWPYLWADPINNLLSIFKYYKDIGTGSVYQSANFFFLGFNSYPLQGIVFTTPPATLLLTSFGIVASIIYRKKFEYVSLLWFLMLLVPILRVTVPGTVIYGGIRQIFEFIPAIALISGIGAKYLLYLISTQLGGNKKAISAVIIGVVFIFSVIPILRLHPNENIYFNFLIGGLKGAKEKNFPAWGNSFGNAYCQGISWINKNAEKNAKLALIQGTPANTPAILIRADIQYNYSGNSTKTYFSSNAKMGEYLMELTYGDSSKPNSDIWRYVENYLEPIFEVKADNVSILKIWKNDPAHTKRN